MTVQELMFPLIEQYERKNTAYGNSAHVSYLKFGAVSYAIRLSDKFQRYESLLEDPSIPVGDESILDTLGDAITYALMCSGDLNTWEDGTQNVRNTLDAMFLLSSMDNATIDQIAREFANKYMPQDHKLTTTIYDASRNNKITPVFCVALAAYCANEYLKIKGGNENGESK